MFVNLRVLDGYFYPRSPCGERLVPIDRALFQQADFYPRSPCGERLYHRIALIPHQQISIHALLAESDFGLLCMLHKIF